MKLIKTTLAVAVLATFATSANAKKPAADLNDFNLAAGFTLTTSDINLVSLVMQTKFKPMAVLNLL